ncbi:MAG: lysophospholipid transporter LplT [Roseateles depolymerans]|uniref:Lysophospholipid transporter LplT n=1 Tax=Roseateles depolymerans TaxID=76731 RepID=A0A2W5DF88_9BURK|nr:MAG: lysophospholipid transporter LplT [Roseateles depolymerans]
MPRGFGLLIAAQFSSALADNAVLIVAIALLAQQGLPAWWAPLLKFGFMLAYVLLAPWVGPLADGFAKGRVMAAMNLVKMLGLALLACGLHPVAALAVVGLGAAAYAPAKYGLITELAEPEALVKANGWIEISVVSAALLGAVLGGALVSPAWLGSSAAAWGDVLELPADKLTGSLVALLLIYLLSSALNAGIPDSGRRSRCESLHPRALLADFRHDNHCLWRDREGGLSLAATTLFWGVGATLQFAVLRWAGQALALPLSQAAYLQAAVAVGVIIGAASAGRWLALHQARHGLWAGVALGLLMPVVAQIDQLLTAALTLALVGAVGGAMVVPLNALLQHRGAVLLSAGRSIAVQGFNENLSVLAMLAVYAGCEAAGVAITTTLSGLGVLVAGAIAGLIWRDAGRRRRTLRDS